MTVEEGKRYSQQYVARGAPEPDSKKARFRLAGLCEDVLAPFDRRVRSFDNTDYDKRAQKLVERKLGIRFATAIGGQLFYSWQLYFERVAVLEMLDTITVVTSVLHQRFPDGDRPTWFVREARRIFTEENLAYEIDDLGGVHPLIDAEFTRQMAATIAGLDAPRYEASAASIAKIDDQLLQDPPDYIGAIRAVFGACENTFKLMYDVPRLDTRAAENHIGRDQQRLYEGHPTAQSASAQFLKGFKGWIDAAHWYRHEPGVETPNQPPAELAIQLISQGLGHVRWLVALDRLLRDK